MPRIVIGRVPASSGRRTRTGALGAADLSIPLAASSSSYAATAEAGVIPFIVPIATAAGKAIGKAIKKNKANKDGGTQAEGSSKKRIPLGKRLDQLRQRFLKRRRAEAATTDDGHEIIDIVEDGASKASTALQVGAILQDTDGYRRRI
jgi:hypothetical protein